MKEQVLVLIKPDGITKNLTGYILTRLAETKLEIVAAKMIRVSRDLAEKNYQHLKGKPFFEQVIQYSLGAFHEQKCTMGLVLWGEGAIRKCRALTGATNPEEADPRSIRGSCGRITTKGVYENVIHVSSDLNEAEREIKLWFEPDEIIVDVYRTEPKTKNSLTKKVWK